MSKTLTAVAVVLMLSAPAAFAEGNNGNNGLPSQPIAVGQVDYSGSFVKQEVQAVRQASVPSDVQQAQIGVPSAQELGTGTN
jgi:hypothetical protein